ncbi:MAG: hypothetical protein WBI41_08330, partial [Azovibrio sp.]|uniref:hypothetical protein n=1 Tax=Azovibrio sp. TaxID=1872673 RepID=UPI003C763C21
HPAVFFDGSFICRSWFSQTISGCFQLRVLPDPRSGLLVLAWPTTFWTQSRASIAAATGDSKRESVG